MNIAVKLPRPGAGSPAVLKAGAATRPQEEGAYSEDATLLEVVPSRDSPAPRAGPR